MSAVAASFALRKHVSDALVDVFEAKLRLRAEPALDNLNPQFSEQVMGSVGIAGDNVTGAVYIHLSNRFATHAAATVLGRPSAELGEADINDTVGEMCSLLTGGLKSALCDAGVPCEISTPAIIRGGSFRIEPMPDARSETLLFDCQGERVVVEIHIKFS